MYKSKNVTAIKPLNHITYHSVSKIMAKINSKIILILVVALPAMFSSAYAQSAENQIVIDLSDAGTSMHEIALLQVLTEVCPPLLNKRQKISFSKNYPKELALLLPKVNNRDKVLKYLSTQHDYKVVLSSMRSWTNEFPREENKALCAELAEYN